MKKQFNIPRVFLVNPIEVSPDPTGAPGSGIGGMSIKPIPMSYAEWAQSRWVADYDENPGVDFQDYAKWWSQASLGDAAWAQFNPGADLDK